ncbi:ComEA family DNA-binding protein [Albibacterium bauzanense]|uniref:Helix-hairpin-helix protein n=1 Tax=Albibacterium bauzanense TaxID=653929 RepID=A0A4R1M501_9SPHI|nr:helix-hairpin-helix domain-containing protein [Albibacterium bauzanense]TCK84813.1 helix-hairpin-helix protein [Albibacterium bauzanense]
MHFRYIIYAFVLGQISVKGSFAQQFFDTETIVESIIGEMIEEAEDEFDYSDISERLEFYIRNPIDLNKTDEKELTELYFLSSTQISELLLHRELSGSFISLYELQAIEGFSDQIIQRLLPFVSIRQSVDQSALNFKDGKHDLILRYGRVLEKQKGYLTPERPGQSHYLGTPDRLFVRYRYQLGNKLQFALNMKKDAGEDFFKGDQRSGFDFYSASFFIKDIGKIQNLALGDYSLQLGQGLSLWNGFSFGKGSLVQHVARQNIGLRPYTSANESQYLRGVAATIKFGQIEILPFVSYKKFDGTLSSDSLSFSSIGISGYHRTPAENKNRNSASQLLYGLNVFYNSRNLKVGTMAFQTAFDKPMLPNQQLYNAYAFRGERLTNSSVYYHYTFRNIYAFGESAYSFNSGIGSVNGLIASLSHQLSLVLLHRYYQKDFHSFFSQGFSENTKTINENGLYTGLILNLSPRVEWVGYADYFRFPWMKYQVDGPSSGYDLFSQFVYSPRKTLNITLRYRYRNKEENDALKGPINKLENVVRQQARVEVKYDINDVIQFRNRLELIDYSKGENLKEKGYMAYHDIVFKPLEKAISGNVRIAAFKTDGYNSRIYAFENDVLYGYSSPSYHNTGIRLYTNIRYRLQRNLDFWLRYASFLYADRGISSGLDYIEGNIKSDIRLQLRMQF